MTESLRLLLTACMCMHRLFDESLPQLSGCAPPIYRERSVRSPLSAAAPMRACGAACTLLLDACTARQKKRQ